MGWKIEFNYYTYDYIMLLNIDFPGCHFVYMIVLEQNSHSKGQMKSFLTMVECNADGRGMFTLGKCITGLQGSRTPYKRLLLPLKETALTKLLQFSLGGETHDLVVMLCIQPEDADGTSNESSANTLRWGASLHLSFIADKPMGETFSVPESADKLAECIEVLQKIKSIVKIGKHEAKHTVEFHPVRSKRYINKIGNLINSER